MTLNNTDAQNKDAAIEGSGTTTTASDNTTTQSAETGFKAAYDKARQGLTDSASEKPTKANGVEAPETKAPAQVTDATPKPLTAPERWTPERKALFDKQSPEVQQAWLDQHKDWETGYGKKFEELSTARKTYEAIQSQFSDPDIRQQMQRAGMNEADTIGKLLALQKQYMMNPAQYIAGIIEHSGLDPRIFLKGANGQGSVNDALAPIVRPLMQEINQLKEHQAAANRERTEAALKASEATLSQMIQETDTDGTLRFPYVERVADQMADLIENDPRFAAMDAREQFETAYFTSVYSNPALRAEMLDAEASKKAQAMLSEQRTERTQAAATLKPRASSSVPPSNKAEGMRGAFDLAQKQLRRH